MKRFIGAVVLGVMAMGMVVSAQEGKGQESAPAKAENAASPKEAKGLAVGARAPEARMRDSAGKEVKLSEVYAKGPVVVTFYRGGWCPFCMRQLREWQDRLEELKAAGGTLVAVTLETPELVDSTAKKQDLGFVVLSDYLGEAMRGYRIGYSMDEAMQKTYKGYKVDLTKSNETGKWEMPNAATFVVGKDGVITYVFNDADYKVRAKPDEVIAAVNKAAGKAKGSEDSR